MRILGFIPARGGSRGVPGKNIRLMNGRPMLWYTLTAALESGIEDIVVSSDDDRILKVAAEIGRERALGRVILHERPSAISGDRATIDEAVLDFLEKDPGRTYDYLVVLPPTSPVRKRGDIERAVKQLTETNAPALVAVSDPMEHPGDMVLYDESGGFRFLLDRTGVVSRQDYARTYFVNGALYGARMDVYLRERTFFFHNTVPFLMDQKYSLDVDSPDDFFIAEAVLMRLEREGV